MLFGDGAGAAVLKRVAEHGNAGISQHVHAQRRHARRPALSARAAARRCRSPTHVLEDRSHFVKMAGREVFKHAVRSMADAADRALDGAKLTGQRHRPADPAPGERPHHRGDGEARQHPDGQGLRERRPLRQHVVGVDSDRARRSDRERARQGGHRPCCSSRSAPASPGRRWSSASERMDIVLLFPGQGSQKPGMGKDLADALSRRARRLRATPTRRSASPLSRALLRGTGRGADADAQRAARAARARRGGVGRRCATSIGAQRRAPPPGTRSASSRRITPPTSLSFADAVRLVRRRGELMYETGVAAARRDGRDPRRHRRVRSRRSASSATTEAGTRRPRELQLARADRHQRRDRRRRARHGAGEGSRRQARDAAQRQRRLSLAAHGDRRGGPRRGARPGVSSPIRASRSTRT